MLGDDGETLFSSIIESQIFRKGNGSQIILFLDIYIPTQSYLLVSPLSACDHCHQYYQWPAICNIHTSHI